MKNTFLFLFLLFSILSYSQIIKGIVTDENNNPITGNVLVKKSKNSDLILQFSAINRKGEYLIYLDNPLDSIVLEVKVYSYEILQREIFSLREKTKIIIENFKLIPITNALKEVIITDEKPLTIKKDTTIYNPDSFKDGSEKVVEDLLRKLPGIKVDENGTIKFKGKNIKKMLLDGEDLFSNQYTIGSKNIDVAMIDKIEAIDNFSENQLLKGLENTGDVAINLKFKKGKTNLSGNADLGFGYKEKYNLLATQILLNSTTKSFGVASFNNIGINNTPYDFYSNKLSVESVDENKFIAKEVIDQGNFNSQLDNKFHRINKNFYTSLNSLYKFSKKITAKINLSIYSDKLSRTNTEKTIFSSNEESFVISQREDVHKSPKLYNANFYLSNLVSKSLNWDYLCKMDYQDINYQGVTSNNSLLQYNNVGTKKWFAKQIFNFTKRINDKNGVTSSVSYTNSNAPQNFILTPGSSINEDSIVKQNRQSSNFSKVTFSGNATLLGKVEKFRWTLKMGYYNEKNKYNSSLETSNSDDKTYTDDGFQNNFIFKYDFPYLNCNISFDNKKIVFKVGVGSQYFNIKSSDAIRDKIFNEEKIAFSPSLNFLYRITKRANMSSGYSFNQITPQETNLFEGIVQTSFSSFKNNEANIQFLKTHNFNINFNYGDSFNLTYIRFGINYNLRENNYFSRLLITQNYIVSSSFLLNSGNRDYSANFSGEKYVPFLRTNFKLSTNYTVSFDKSVVNNSNLRDIRSEFFMLDFSAKVTVAKKMFFENGLLFNSNSYFVEDVKQNNFSSLKDSFKTIFKINKQFNSITTLNYIIPDLSLSKNYWFLDSELTFASKNKKIEYSVIARNLTNNKSFEIVSASDYSRTISSHNLINRFILASVAFKF